MLKFFFVSFIPIITSNIYPNINLIFTLNSGAGNEHSLFVGNDGQVLVSGYNENGQCGSGKTEQVKHPQQILALQGEFISKVFTFNGCEHSLAVTSDGRLYSFGYNYRGQLGHGNTAIESIPRLVKGLLSKRVLLAASSYHHSLFFCSDGTLFSCGRNDCGQLGQGDFIDKKTPQQILYVGDSNFNDLNLNTESNSNPNVNPASFNSNRICLKNLLEGRIVGISCGQFHTVMLTIGGDAYSCGKNDYGQTCKERKENVNLLSKIVGVRNQDRVKQVCCGYYHTLILSLNGTVTGYGRNDYGQLGLGHSQARVYGGQTVAYLTDKNVVALASGCYHSIAITGNGMLYVFGRNNHGQLGIGDLEDYNVPHPVDDFVGCRILTVSFTPTPNPLLPYFYRYNIICDIDREICSNYNRVLTLIAYRLPQVSTIL